MQTNKSVLIDFPMPIKTPRLILRPPRIGEGRMLNEAVLESFEALNKFMPWAKEKPSWNDSDELVKKEVEKWISKDQDDLELMLFILDTKTNDLIGVSGFHGINFKTPSIETGYWVRKKYSGQGFITEAINAMTQYVFKVLHVKRIAITCDVDNERSKKIPERLGYRLESIIKADRVKPISGEVSDTLVYVRHDLVGLPELKVTWGDEDF